MAPSSSDSVNSTLLSSSLYPSFREKLRSRRPLSSLARLAHFRCTGRSSANSTRADVTWMGESSCRLGFGSIIQFLLSVIVRK